MELELNIVSSATTGNTEKVFAERNDHFRLKKPSKRSSYEKFNCCNVNTVDSFVVFVCENDVIRLVAENGF